jgi:hypothetical protein
MNPFEFVLCLMVFAIFAIWFGIFLALFLPRKWAERLGLVKSNDR